ncbi:MULTISPECIES: Rieske (2Fe-2S) protein [Ferrimicrobium]|uniref:Rieske (2Fe-2S) protein n=1 Tax=Ferrimicrobium TaxID=121038 RepID=UPI0023F1596A|nr:MULTISPECIES: Rieske (2Fe-2S) protein [Ferrimicrobium]
MLVFVRAGDRVGLASVRRAVAVGVVSLVDAPEAAEVIVVEISQESDLEELRKLRGSSTQAVIVAHTMRQDQALWQAAERSGADKVVSSGGLSVLLRQLDGRMRSSERRERLIPLCWTAEVAGRLGIIASVQHDLGELMLVKEQGKPVCLVGPCPHAGESLGRALVEDGVITCPAHGSQFLVAGGERVRGPADCGLMELRVVEDGGRYWAVSPPLS